MLRCAGKYPARKRKLKKIVDFCRISLKVILFFSLEVGVMDSIMQVHPNSSIIQTKGYLKILGMRGIYIPEHSCNAHPRTSEAIYDLLVINVGVLDSQVGIMPISITRYIFNGGWGWNWG